MPIALTDNNWPPPRLYISTKGFHFSRYIFSLKFGLTNFEVFYPKSLHIFQKFHKIAWSTTVWRIGFPLLVKNTFCVLVFFLPIVPQNKTKYSDIAEKCDRKSKNKPLNKTKKNYEISRKIFHEKLEPFWRNSRFRYLWDKERLKVTRCLPDFRPHGFFYVFYLLLYFLFLIREHVKKAYILSWTFR